MHIGCLQNTDKDIFSLFVILEYQKSAKSFIGERVKKPNQNIHLSQEPNILTCWILSISCDHYIKVFYSSVQIPKQSLKKLPPEDDPGRKTTKQAHPKMKPPSQSPSSKMHSIKCKHCYLYIKYYIIRWNNSKSIKYWYRNMTIK